MTDETKALDSEFENLGEKLKARTLALAEGAIELTEDQLQDLTTLTDDTALALAGDERAKAMVTARLKQAKFSTEAQAYLELVEFREAFAQALLDFASGAITVGAKVAAEFLAGLLAQA